MNVLLFMFLLLLGTLIGTPYVNTSTSTSNDKVKPIVVIAYGKTANDTMAQYLQTTMGNEEVENNTNNKYVKCVFVVLSVSYLCCFDCLFILFLKSVDF